MFNIEVVIDNHSHYQLKPSLSIQIALNPMDYYRFVSFFSKWILLYVRVGSDRGNQTGQCSMALSGL